MAHPFNSWAAFTEQSDEDHPTGMAVLQSSLVVSVLLSHPEAGALDFPH